MLIGQSFQVQFYNDAVAEVTSIIDVRLSELIIEQLNALEVIQKQSNVGSTVGCFSVVAMIGRERQRRMLAL